MTSRNSLCIMARYGVTEIYEMMALMNRLDDIACLCEDRSKVCINSQ